MQQEISHNIQDLMLLYDVLNMIIRKQKNTWELQKVSLKMTDGNL